MPSLENDWEFALLGMQYDVIDQVQRALEAGGLSQSDLARAMGVSRAYVSKILNEQVNFKMETIAKLAVALKKQIALRLISKNEKVVVENLQSPKVNSKRAGQRKQTYLKSALVRQKTANKRTRVES
ncbi:helix-turn-helix domain-containing protein [bacterium]|nr:helix-turn-helix domain-containing protein [bacterium]